MKNFLDKAGRLLAYIENAVIVTGFLIMFFVLLAQVIMRYVFNSPLTWSEETARFIFVYVSFVGISFAYRQKAHIRMEAVVKLLPPGIQTFLEAGIQAGLLIYKNTVIGGDVLSPELGGFIHGLERPT